MKTIKYILTINFILCIAFTIMAQGIVVITGNETWTSNQDIDYGIQIEPGAVLTIESTVRFAPDAKLIVKRGGKLTVDGGVLTNLNSNSLWPGIEVWGRSDKSQYSSHPNGYLYQGKASFTNGALIMNAFIGVLAGKTDDEFDYKNIGEFPVIPLEPGYAGGIIMAHSSEFRNNKIGVYLPEYKNFHPVNEEPRDNLSYFKNSDFKLTNLLLNNTDPLAFLKLVGVDGILTEGNHFINDFKGNATKNNKGILSLNSSFVVKEYCMDNYIPCQNIRISKFEELAMGIHAMGIGNDKSFSVDTSHFIEAGVIINNVNNFIVTRSKFNTSNLICLIIDGESSGFRIEENEFEYIDKSIIFEQIYLGIIFNNTGETFNELYKNKFTSLYYANMALRINREENGLKGLTFKCNHYIDSKENDIYVNPVVGWGGVAPYQGSLRNSPDAPAGNRFSWTEPYGDFLNFGSHVTYYYHDNSYEHLKPMFSYGITKVPSSVTWDPNISCPSKINPPDGPYEMAELKMLISVNKQNVESTLEIISALKDAGNTYEMNNDVLMSAPWQSMDIYNKLMVASPYLSNKVLASAIQKENVLLDAMIRNILVANPQSAKNNELLELLDQRFQALPDYMWEEILEGRNIVSAYENLEATLSNYLKNEAEYQNQLIHLYLKENTKAAKDSIINILLSGNSLQHWYQAAFIRQEYGDNSEALNILNNINNEFDLNTAKLDSHNDIIAFVNEIETQKQQGKSITQPDSVAIDWLVNIMNFGSAPSSNFARNILVTHGIIDYEFDDLLPDLNKSNSIKYEIDLKHNPHKDILNLHPNPVNDFVIVSYDVSSITKEYLHKMLNITSIDGKVMESITLNKTKDSMVLPLVGYKPGSYFITIYLDKHIIDSKNLIIR